MSSSKVIITGPVFGAFYSECEVADSADSESKVLTFSESAYFDILADRGGRVKNVRLIQHIQNGPSPMDVETVRGERYRIVRQLGERVYEGTTKPAPAAVAAPPVEADDAAYRCEMAIMKALESETEIPVSALKRKAHAHRFGAARWQKALKALADGGEIRLEERAGRDWVCLHQSSDDTAP